MKDNQNDKHHVRADEEASKIQSEASEAKEVNTDSYGEAGVRSGQAFSWKRLMAKKWVFPAVYMAAAAIILSIMWAIQTDRDDQMITEETPNQLTDHVNSGDGVNDAFPVAGTAEGIEWPVADPSEVEVIRPFYDENGTNEVKQAATIQYGNTLEPSMGITLSRPDGETFAVFAAMSGTVTRAQELPIVGQLVEITHEDGLKTVYSSLSNVTVSEGDEVVQGDHIADAGRSEMGKELIGQQLHFEVLENDEYVNPSAVLPELE